MGRLYALFKSSSSSSTAKMVCLAGLISQDAVLSVPFCSREINGCISTLPRGSQGCTVGSLGLHHWD